MVIIFSMLVNNTYPAAYISACQALVASQLAAYQALKLPPGKATAAFEVACFNQQVLALDRMFVHRTRGREGKDGNALNEVRMLCDGLLEQGGTLVANSTIKYDAAKAVLKLPLGAAIALTAADFQRLQQAFFAELAARFGE